MATQRVRNKRKLETLLQDWENICEVVGIPLYLAQCLSEEIDLSNVNNYDENQLNIRIGIALGKSRLKRHLLFSFANKLLDYLKKVQLPCSSHEQGGDNEGPAVLFGIGINPFKIEVRLPNRMIYSVNVVNSACCAQGVQSLPEYLASGEFISVCERNGTRIYQYEFFEQKGCRSIDTDYHGMFPMSMEKLIKAGDLITYSNEQISGLGNKINAGDHEELVKTEVKSGDIYATYKYKEVNNKVLESNVQERILQHLKSKLTDCNASVTSRNNCKLSQFSGGGDIELAVKQQTAVLTLGGESGPVNEDESDYGVQSPVYQDEIKPTQDSFHIELQLRANMLCLSRNLESVLKSYTLDQIKLLNTMTICGVTFGCQSILRLMKLTVNFREQITITSVRFKSGESFPWAIEGALSYILHKMMAKSVASVTPTSTPTPPPPTLRE